MAANSQDFKTLVRIFVENQSDNYNLTIYDISLLRVIADYCDMPLGYCCLCFSKLEKFSRMKETQRRKSLNYLISQKIVFRTESNGKIIYRVGETITGKPDGID